MTKKKTTKHALLMSALSLMMCVTMFVGSTFAWFTDEVTSAGNIIKSGTLDVTMEWADGTKAVPTVESSDWKDASTGAIFNSELWEPGYTEVRHIKIANEGTLALKYQLNIVANGEVSDLADVIDVYYVDPAVQVSERTALTDANKLGTLTQVLANISTTASGNLKVGDNPHTITIALKMQETAGNEYQDKAIGSDFSVQLLATQLTSENDSFDNQYDANAKYDGEVGTADELAAALAKGGKFKLLADITANESIVVPENVTAMLNLNGKTITGSNSKASGAVIVNNGSLTITGDTESVIKNTATDGATTILNNGSLVLNGGKIESAPWGGTNQAWPSYGIISNGDITINAGATVVGAHGAVAVDNGVGVINGGDFSITGCSLLSDHVLYAPGQLTVNGGEFTVAVDKTVGGDSMFSGNIVLTGGTYNEDPSKDPVKGINRVQEGHQVIDNEDGTWTVKSNAVVLSEALSQGNTVILEDNILVTDTIEVAEGVTAILDLNDKEIIMNGEGREFAIDNYGTLTVKGGTVEVANTNGGSAIRNYGTMTVEDATLDGAPFGGDANDGWPSYVVNNYGEATISNTEIKGDHGGVACNEGSKTILNSVTVRIGHPAITSNGVIAYADSELSINGGTYMLSYGSHSSCNTVRIMEGATYTTDGKATFSKGVWNQNK
ncbi:MAG: hypothetical protein IKK59_07325 [Lachnospiraceae bacterium]|nr:hypothetical protein [Lachnospiraceae bacterium]